MKPIKYFTLILTWLLLPPLFIFLGKKWKVIRCKKAILVSLFSPFSIGVYISIAIFFHFVYFNFYREYHYIQAKTLKNITQMDIPSFKVKEYEKGDMLFMGDYSDRILIQFDEALPDSFFITLDSLVQEGVWNKSGNKYYFNKMWGNGIPAPKGENIRKERSLSMELSRGSLKAEISHGTW